MMSRHLLLPLLFTVGILFQPLHAVGSEGNLSKQSILKERVLENSGWKLIVNETFGFFLQVPISSRIDSRRVSGDSEYIRIQNYQPSDNTDLKPNTYWLEIFVFDHKAKQKIWGPCAGLILQPTIESQGTVKVYRGVPRDVSPDAGGHVRGMCAETADFDIYFQASENNKDTPILDNIYRSFHLPPEDERY